MRKALVVGINHYDHVSGLFGCATDAHAVNSALERNADGTVNFAVRLLIATDLPTALSREALREQVKKVFEGENETALFYFAGHGHIESTGGYLCASDCKAGHDGLSIDEVLTFASQSKSKNKIVVLDSCHSGIAGDRPHAPARAELQEGMTILTASTAEQYASEENGRGVFTSLMVDGLMGAAANLVGEVTPGAVYAHVDQSLGPWEQRPVFKTNVKGFVSLRTAQAAIPLEHLRRLPEFFPAPGDHIQLDPSYEPERPSPDETGWPLPDPAKNAIFAILQKFNRVNLVVPVDAPHMWHAAVESKSCKLTVLGEHYWRLARRKRI